MNGILVFYAPFPIAAAQLKVKHDQSTDFTPGIFNREINSGQVVDFPLPVPGKRRFLGCRNCHGQGN
jgi:hypothetical protein